MKPAWRNFAARPPAGLTLERLRELYTYEPETGLFRATYPRSGPRRPSGISGSMGGDGYRTIWMDNVQYRAHRLAWLWMTETWPEDQLDHINGDRDDNRFVNLRLATNALNMANRKKNEGTSSPYKGVLFKKKKGWWIARVQANGMRHEKSGFKTAEEAFAARNAMAAVYHGEFARAA